jgi:hypothetical protein
VLPFYVFDQATMWIVHNFFHMRHESADGIFRQMVEGRFFSLSTADTGAAFSIGTEKRRIHRDLLCRIDRILIAYRRMPSPTNVALAWFSCLAASSATHRPHLARPRCGFLLFDLNVRFAHPGRFQHRRFVHLCRRRAFIIRSFAAKTHYEKQAVVDAAYQTCQLQP